MKIQATIFVLYKLIVTTVSAVHPYQLFQNYQLLTDRWMQGDGGEDSSKDLLSNAMESISSLIPILLSQSELPSGLDPMVTKFIFEVDI